MKNLISIKSVGAIVAVVCCYHPGVSRADDPAPDAPAVPKPVPAPIVEVAEPKAKVRLSPPAEEVLKLARAKVSEGTIVSFVMNSGSTYNLNVSEIIYLREQGVTDFVITTMLDQSHKLSEKYPAHEYPPHEAIGEEMPRVAMAFTNGVQTAPLVPSAGTVYSVPDSGSGYYYDGYYGYPGYGYWGPGFALRLGFGGPPFRGPGGPGGPRGGPRPGGPPGGPGGRPGGGPGGGPPGGGHPGGPGGGPGGGHGGGPGGGGHR